MRASTSVFAQGKDRGRDCDCGGIGAGAISYVIIKLALGKVKDVHPILYGVAVLFTLYFLRGPLESAIL